MIRSAHSGNSLSQARIWRQASRSTQRPIGTIRPVSSAIGMKPFGRNEATLGMLPAHQRLEAAQLLIRQRHDRLVVELELLALDRPPQIRFDEEPLLRRERASTCRRSRSAPCRDPWRDTSPCRRRAPCLPPADTAASRHDDADADRHDDLTPFQLERLATRRHQPLGDRARVDRVADAGEQHRELVAAEPRERALAVEPRDGVRAPQRLLEPARDAGQQLVAGGMTQTVVDDLEAIDVEEEHREVEGAGGSAARDLLVQPIHEQHPVGQAGQRIGAARRQLRPDPRLRPPRSRPAW